MHLYKSSRPNLFHYVTTVTHRRTRLFSCDIYCDLLIQAIAKTRADLPFKLVGYVIMPDHVHLLLNPLERDIRKTMNLVKGRAARSILTEIRNRNDKDLLRKLGYSGRSSRGQTHRVWQRGFSSIDIESDKFIRQKLGYIHMNPVRAGLVDHPAKWKYSSCGAFLPKGTVEVPIEIDFAAFWNYEETDPGAIELRRPDRDKFGF